MYRKLTATGLTAFSLFFFSLPAHAGDGRVEGFAGYYFAEETDEDISFGVRGGWDSGRGWGLMLGFETFETSGEGYGVRNGVDADISHLELSYVAYPGGSGFELFSGLGATDLDVDIPVHGHVAGDLDGATLSIHAGVGYRANLGDSLYIRPEIRARTYDAEDETIDFTASIAIGFRWEGD